jgi:hypothetical protein
LEREPSPHRRQVRREQPVRERRGNRLLSRDAGRGRDGALDDDARAWLDEADAICRADGFRAWSAKIDSLRG